MATITLRKRDGSKNSPRFSGCKPTWNYNEPGDDTVRRSCDECSKFLFERPPQTGGFKRPGG